jgi:protocatechuate 3,4-dioxygenase beta subunit
VPGKLISANLTRRHAIAGLASAGASIVAARTASAQETLPQPTGLLAQADACVLTPQAEEGPFYFDPKLERADIGDGRPGVPLKVRFRVIEAAGCAPLVAARTDVWHADASGIYSGYEGQGDRRKLSTIGQTFLRGTQRTGDAGQVDFTTVYPGWYMGRTAHLHFKIFLDERNVLTGQMFFPDALSEFIYTNVAPYRQRGRERDTINKTDGVLRASGGSHASFCSIKEESDHYLASMVIAVDRTAAAGSGRPSMPPPGFGPRPTNFSGPKSLLVPGAKEPG